MKNLKLELFEFKKGLSFEQSDISNIVEAHMNGLDIHSEKAIVNSLNERLAIYTYDDSVNSLLENLNSDVEENELEYELKDLYRTVEKKDNNMVYRQPLNVILEIINMKDDRDRMSKIMNELSVYNWVPEIRTFMTNLTGTPEQKANLLNGGSSNEVFTIVEQVEGGHIAFLHDSWFLLQEDSIDKAILEEHVKDNDKLRMLRTLESALKYTDITESRIDFKISENLVVGISTKNPNETFINEEKMNKETSLENLFSSPIIPIVNKNFFPLIKEVASNIDKFVDLDVVRKVENITNPFKDIYVFNYKANNYLYTIDTRYGNSFYKYESAMELIDDVKNEMQYDITHFFENKLSKEVKMQRRLEDKIREISVDIEDIDRNIDKVETNIEMLGESKVLDQALKSLTRKKVDLEKELKSIKELQYKEVIQK